MRRLPVLICSLLLLAPGVLADTVVLKNGRSFEGRVVKETPTHVHLKVPGLGEQPIPKSDIKEVKKGPTIFDEYDAKKAGVVKDDADGHYKLGLWCEEVKLRQEAKTEFEAAMAADPEHAGARTKLGFVRYKGEWLTKKRHAEVMKELAKKEGEILAALALADPHEDREARFAIGCPKEWEKEAAAGSVAFAGPELGGAPVRIEFTLGQLEDSLETFVEDTTKALKRIHEDLAPLGDPADAKLLAAPAKFLAFGYSEDGVPMERHELLMVAPEGSYRLFLSCAAGYFDRLKPFFDKVSASLKRLERPADVEVKEHGYACCYPDENWQKIGNFPLAGPDRQPMSMPEGSTVMIHKSAPPACIVVLPGKKGDGRADPTSLESLRDSIGRIFPFPHEIAGDQKSTTVAGASALAGEFTIQGGQMGSGHWCVFTSGDRYYVVILLNLLNRLGPQYAAEDFGKFLSAFKLL
ncbi:MAG: hypothetical protein MUE73_05510 [Planctomycetes bacterium]|jgi:hypothetical protein|nr:hypothetical protein [Planctomycetota bacterium]